MYMYLQETDIDITCRVFLLSIFFRTENNPLIW